MPRSPWKHSSAARGIDTLATGRTGKLLRSHGRASSSNSNSIERPCWGSTSLTGLDSRLRERAADAFAARVVDKLGEPAC